MQIKSRYTIAKCALGKSCKKCASIHDPIVVDRGVHLTLYCSSCGAYIKHASVDDKHHFYVARVKVEDMTPTNVCILYVESEESMYGKRNNDKPNKGERKIVHTDSLYPTKMMKEGNKNV